MAASLGLPESFVSSRLLYCAMQFVARSSALRYWVCMLPLEVTAGQSAVAGAASAITVHGRVCYAAVPRVLVAAAVRVRSRAASQVSHWRL